MVFDAMVIAYALLRAPGYWRESANAIERADQILVPDLYRAELANVVWQWVEARGVPLELARQVLRDAEGLVTRVVSSDVLWEQALELAVARHHPAYDMLFVALAAGAGVNVVTYDRKLRKLCPEHVLTVAEFLRR